MRQGGEVFRRTFIQAAEGEGGEEKEEEGVRETRSGAELAARWAEIAPQLVRITSVSSPPDLGFRC